VGHDLRGSHARSSTLAADIFRETPELRQVAHRVEAHARLDKHTPQVKIDDQIYYVAEGDLLLDGDEFDLHVLQRARSQDGSLVCPSTSAAVQTPTGLIGTVAGNRMARWSPDVVLRYCIISASFSEVAHYDMVRQNVSAATSEWEGVCGVSFEHALQWDGHPTPDTPANQIDPSLVFSVRCTGLPPDTIATAFFPTHPPARRKLFIDPVYFTSSLQYDPVGVFRHELGHILGFRHEHARGGAPSSCPGEDPRKAFDLTPYDPKSVMHYPCGGAGSYDFRITETDRDGAQKLYGPSWNDVMLVR
jgi:hypothetical protein